MAVDEQVVRSADGTRLRVRSVGHGPGLVIVHGSGRDANDYRPLVRRLARNRRVHRYDRGGRSGGPRPQKHSLGPDAADLTAVVRGADLLPSDLDEDRREFLETPARRP